MYIPASGSSSQLPPDVQELLKSPDLVESVSVYPGQVAPWSFPDTKSGRTAPPHAVKLLPEFKLDGDETSTGDESLKVPRLENWTVEAHAYSMEVAGKIGLLSKLFGGDVKTVQAGVIHEAKRFTRKPTPDGREVEVGVAVRMVAGTTAWDSTLQLSLAMLAADAQLHTRDARISMEVVGFSGPLGGILPAPRQLDVTALGAYLEAFRGLQSEVFGDKGLPFLTPTFLGYTDAESPPARTATEARSK